MSLPAMLPTAAPPAPDVYKRQVEEIFAAQNRNKTQPGVSILPQVEQIHGEKAVEAHILLSLIHI